MSNKINPYPTESGSSLASMIAAGLLSALNGIEGVVQSIAEHRQRRQAIRELDRFSDYELRDIGLSRGDIEWAVRDGRNVGERSRR